MVVCRTAQEAGTPHHEYDAVFVVEEKAQDFIATSNCIHCI